MDEVNKNLYLIRQRLNNLTKRNGDSCFYFYINGFVVKIYNDDKIIDYICLQKTVNVDVYENTKNKEHVYEKYIDLEKDERFKNYQPIKYSKWAGYSTGKNMPINTLCELIIYLYKLSNLTAFW